jgi:hypothetical protein
MAKFAYEFGKRWDVRVPRSDIKHFIARVHVSKTDAEIAKLIRYGCSAPGFTESLIRQSIRYAQLCHARNVDMFHSIMRGYR